MKKLIAGGRLRKGDLIVTKSEPHLLLTKLMAAIDVINTIDGVHVDVEISGYKKLLNNLKDPAHFEQIEKELRVFTQALLNTISNLKIITHTNLDRSLLDSAERILSR